MLLQPFPCIIVVVCPIPIAYNALPQIQILCSDERFGVDAGRTLAVMTRLRRRLRHRRRRRRCPHEMRYQVKTKSTTQHEKEIKSNSPRPLYVYLQMCVHIYMYLGSWEYIDIFPKQSCSLRRRGRGSYFACIELPLTARIAGRQPRLHSLDCIA